MDTKKRLLSFTRILLPAAGFALTCIGAYLVSMQAEHDLKLVPVYVTIAVGFLAMLVGVFWSLCHSMRSKVYQRRRRRREHHPQIFTIESRPSCFPPSYEESEGHVSPGNRTEVVLSVNRDVMSPAPPLYSQDSLEPPDCRWSWEHPPRYSQVVQTPHQQTDVSEQRGVLSPD